MVETPYETYRKQLAHEPMPYKGYPSVNADGTARTLAGSILKDQADGLRDLILADLRDEQADQWVCLEDAEKSTHVLGIALLVNFGFIIALGVAVLHLFMKGAS